MALQGAVPDTINERELLKIDGLSEEHRLFLQTLSNISERKKIARISFYIQHKLFRNNRRNILMLIFV